jgi:hypothetical protein
MLRRTIVLISGLALGVVALLVSAGAAPGGSLGGPRTAEAVLLPPAAPTNLHICGGRELCLAGYVTLLWDDNAWNEDRYEFEWLRARTGVPPEKDVWNRVTLARNDEGHALHQSLFVRGSLYYFRVRACSNAGGCSVYSNRVSYTP